MLTHHGLKDYKEAASEAAKTAKIKMEEIIHRGSFSASKVIEQVNKTFIKDRLSNSNDIIFKPEGADSMNIYLRAIDEKYELHSNGLLQSVQRSGLPNANRIIELMHSHGEVGNRLLATNLTTLFGKSEKTNLVRTVDNRVLGVLSDRYRRIDSRPLLEKFVEACQLIGARPIEGFVEDTRVCLRAVLPVVFEPVDYEVMIFGFEWKTSDFGHGANQMNLWTKRLWCTNHAILDEVLRQIHLGKRIDTSINFSQTTVNLDIAASASKLYDTVINILSPQRIQIYLEGIKMASERKMTSNEITNFLAAKFSKADRDNIIEQFNTADIEAMPSGMNAWRLSNAISWCANEQHDLDKKFYYQEVAGSLIPRDELIKPVILEPIDM